MWLIRWVFDKRYWAGLSIALIASACMTIHETVTNDVTPAQLPLTFTPVPLSSPSATTRPIITPSPLPTVTPTLTGKATSTVTWTPLPVLSTTERLAYLQELLSHNANCRLPCWWGIEPGTAWGVAQHFLAPFVTDIEYGGSLTTYENGVAYEVTYYGVGYEVPGISYGGYMSFMITNGVIDDIEIGPEGLVERYPLHRMLTEYERPEVYVSSGNKAYGFPFDIYLFYPEQGILAGYSDLAKWNSDEAIYRWCPKPVGPTLWLWSPTDARTLEQFEPRGVSHNLLPIEQATGMSVETFYMTYQDPNTTVCLQTPVELWP